MTQANLVSKNQIKLIGLETRTNNQQESDPATAKIPGIWQKFFTEGIAQKIPDLTNSGNLFGVYTHYQSDHTGEYSLIVGAEVDNLAAAPEGLIGLTIQPARYMVFPVEGELPLALAQTWQHIWDYFDHNPAYKRAYTSDFELYHQLNPAKVDVYIAVK